MAIVNSKGKIKALPVLSVEQKNRVLEVRGKCWDKPVSMWKKMHFDKSKISFVGKR